MTLSRRAATLGLFALPGCAAISTLNDAAQPRDTYELQPVAVGAAGRRTSRSLMVLLPDAPAAIATDRMLIRTDPLSVAYLPDARWADRVPEMFQSVLIRSLAGTGRLGFVGPQGAGPVPDRVLLIRLDDFEVVRGTEGFVARLAFEASVLRDRDQRVLGTRGFAQEVVVSDDRAATIARAFQTLLDQLLPEAVTWVLTRIV